MERARQSRRKAAFSLQLSVFSWQLCGELFVRRQGAGRAAHRARSDKQGSGAKTPSLLRRA